MVNSKKHQFENDQRIEGEDQSEQSVDVSLNGVETPATANPSITRRLTEIFLEANEEDLLLQRSDREDGFLQWLRALDMQVVGACRADERLKPLLKLNVSISVAEDNVLAHLSQHFEPSEIGLLARCLCVPLVPVRVGKIKKQGTLLFPTSIRGNLCLTLLPTSDLHISFNGDDGSVERLATLSSEAQCSAIEIEEIPADKSGRSFLIKTTDGAVSYFWCSEKSKLLGNELLRKMKDLLMKKPSLAELSGISEARLNCFATHLRAYLAGSMVISGHASDVLSANPPSDDTVDPSELQFPQSSFNCQKNSLFQQCGSEELKTNLINQDSVCPNSSFDEGLPKSLFSVRSAGRENFRGQGENYVSPVSIRSAESSNANCFEKDKLPETNGIDQPFATLNSVDAFCKSTELPLSCPTIQVSSSGPFHFSPHYCWCPPVASKLQYALGNSQLPTLSTESLLSAARLSSLLTSKPSLNSTEVPHLDFPSFLPEALVGFPNSQQILTFTPLMSDPIIHIPMIDVCSSGPGYLVSAGSALPSTIPPLNPNLVDSRLPNADPIVEKSCREMLRMLVSSSNQPNPQLIEVLPPVLSSSEDEQNVLATGSRGLYGGTRDVDAISGSLTTVGLFLLSENSLEGFISKSCVSRDDLVDEKNQPSSSGSGFDGGMG